MAIKRVKYKSRDITCPHGNILAEIDGKVCWVSPAEMKRQTGTGAGKPPRKPSPDEDQGEENQDQGEDQGEDHDEGQGSFWGGK